ncbi:MAG: lysylphosphatidylglycerol synthase domain-containing protein [Candidatus Zixiibacteriota bacterium]
MSSKVKKTIFIILKILLVIAAIFFIFKAFGSSWSDIKDLDLSTVDIGRLIASYLVLIIGYILFGLMWIMIIRGHGEIMPIKIGCSIYFLANLFRYIPGKVMQGVSMVYFAKKRGISVTTALSSTVIHQIVFIISGVTISIIFLPPSLFGQEYAHLSYLRIFGLALVIFIYPPFLNFAIRTVSKLTKKELPKIDISFAKLLYYWLFGILVWLVNGIALAIFTSAFKDISFYNFTNVIAIYPTGYVIAFMAIIFPGGIGIREGVFAFFLKDIVGKPLNIAIGGLSRVWIMAMELIVVLPFLFIYLKNRKKGKDWI